MNFDITVLLKLVESMPVFHELITGLNNNIIRTSVPEAAKPFLIAAIYVYTGRPVLVITAQPENARNLYEQVYAWCNTNRVRFFPEPDALPYQRIVSDTSTESERLQVLASLAGQNNEIPLVITSIPALIQKTAPYTDFTGSCHTITAGMKIDPLDLLSRWERMGYRAETLVEIPGTMSHRGGIVDIYTPVAESPARLEFLGNTIETIRLYDPISQRSMSQIESLIVCPSTELITPMLQENFDKKSILDNIGLETCTAEVCRQFEQELEMIENRQKPRNLPFYAPLFNTDSILTYLPAGGLLILDEPSLLIQAAETFTAEAEDIRAQRTGQGELPSNYPIPYFKRDELQSILSRNHLELAEFGTGEDTFKLGFTPAQNYAGQLPVFIDKVKQLYKQKKRVILTSYQASRLEELLEASDMFAPPAMEIKQIPPAASLSLLQGLNGTGMGTGQRYFFVHRRGNFRFCEAASFYQKASRLSPQTIHRFRSG